MFEGALEHDSAATLFSMFKKRVNKQSIKGGSAVQVSAFGIKGYEESGDLKFVADPNNPKNILYAECEIPWDITYTDINGKEIALDYTVYSNEDDNGNHFEDIDYSDCNLKEAVEKQVYLPQEAGQLISDFIINPVRAKNTAIVEDLSNWNVDEMEVILE